MNEELRTELKGGGWVSGTFRGFLLKRVAGIEFEVGPGRGGSGAADDAPRLTLRWRYKTESADRNGEESLPGEPSRARIEDAMTAIYLRVHERPDPARVFGGRRRRPAAGPAPSRPGQGPAPSAPEPQDEGQTSLDF